MFELELLYQNYSATFCDINLQASLHSANSKFFKIINIWPIQGLQESFQVKYITCNI